MIVGRSRNLLKLGQRFSSTLSVKNALIPQTDPYEENLRIRRQLALAYRVIDRLELNEGACNHLTAMAPAKNGSGEVMLVVPGLLENGAALHWSQVTASSFLGIGPENVILEHGSLGGEPEESAACIHLGLRRVVPRAKVVFHTHTDYATALGCLKESNEFPMIHQNGVRFFNRMAFQNVYGLPTVDEEAETLGKILGDKDVLIMCNHGTLIVSPTVHLAFDDTYYLERACSNLMLTMASTGGQKNRLNIIPDNVVQEASAFYTAKTLDLYAKRHFYAYWELYLKEHSDVFF